MVEAPDRRRLPCKRTRLEGEAGAESSGRLGARIATDRPRRRAVRRWGHCKHRVWLRRTVQRRGSKASVRILVATQVVPTRVRLLQQLAVPGGKAGGSRAGDERIRV